MKLSRDMRRTPEGDAICERLASLAPTTRQELLLATQATRDGLAVLSLDSLTARQYGRLVYHTAAKLMRKFTRTTNIERMEEPQS